MRLSCSLSRMRGNLLDTLLNSPDLQTIIGLREWIALPELGVVGLRAKIDTGASTSALHATDISEFKRNGEQALITKPHKFLWPGPLEEINPGWKRRTKLRRPQQRPVPTSCTRPN